MIVDDQSDGDGHVPILRNTFLLNDYICMYVLLKVDGRVNILIIYQVRIKMTSYVLPPTISLIASCKENNESNTYQILLYQYFQIRNGTFFY